jgi:hypothetical protein
MRLKSLIRTTLYILLETKFPAPDVITSALAGLFFDSHSFLVLDSPEIPLLRFLE